MTHPPISSAAPPGAGSALPTPPPPRRTAFAEGIDQLRTAATTEPGRLRLIGAVLALLIVAFGAVTAWQMTARANAADDVLHHSQPLSSDAAEIYRSLADANTAASSAFLAGGQETDASRELYESDIRNAATLLVTAASNAEPGSPADKAVTKLNTLLPEYKGLVERARVYNRQGYPVGGAYLRYANDKMQQDMLPTAQDLYETENTRLSSDYADATPYPWAAMALGVVALAALAWAQLRHYRRTNRLLNHGLVAASGATVVTLLWLVVGHAVARSGLEGSYEHGVRSLTVLHDARIASLKARGNENLSLVSRGAETIEVDGKSYDTYYYHFDQEMAALGDGLAQAAKLADGPADSKPVVAAEANMKAWKQRHSAARQADENGDYQTALDEVIGTKDATAECFESVDKNLNTALTLEKHEFQQRATDGRDAMTGLPIGAAMLGVAAASGALFGIGRRLSEYR
ncbi:hypothetical protein EDD90_7084 [Streptomyces sp. Ag109_O5-1]|uniref:hypothetical protein n=1 Tax=Streptomyces sp. Ag109_O5-1 TaxID=1938851 RepID=UPI000FB8661F|nr:hypothetical protein EDD90_7084 [Streptomyces sp. Ag109_O5-1]